MGFEAILYVGEQHLVAWEWIIIGGDEYVLINHSFYCPQNGFKYILLYSFQGHLKICLLFYPFEAYLKIPSGKLT